MPLNGMDVGDLANGGVYVKLHHYADPAKDDVWLEERRKGIPERQFLREYLMHEDVYDGQPVYRSFVEGKHAPERFRQSGIPIVAGSTFRAGWDCGNTGSPAFALRMTTPGGLRCWILEVVPTEFMPMSTFAPIVRQALMERIPADWLSVDHIADPAGLARSGVSDVGSAFDVAAKAGFTLRPCSEVGIWNRVNAVEWGLRDEIEVDKGKFAPRTIYDPKFCPVLLDGLRGAYCMRVSGAYEQSGPGMKLEMPVKNQYSHVQDAHAYASVEDHKETVSSGGVGSASLISM